MMLKKVGSERPQAEPDFFPVTGLNKYKSFFYFFKILLSVAILLRTVTYSNNVFITKIIPAAE